MVNFNFTLEILTGHLKFLETSMKLKTVMLVLLCLAEATLAQPSADPQFWYPAPPLGAAAWLPIQPSQPLQSNAIHCCIYKI